MVRIINYKERQKEDGTNFYALEIQGGVEMVKSKETGQFYATAKKASITSTFDEETCKALIGTEIAGSVAKVAVEPYTYTVRETGEEITLTHRWVYVPEGEKANEDQAVQDLMADTNAFSRNGHYSSELEAQRI